MATLFSIAVERDMRSSSPLGFGGRVVRLADAKKGCQSYLALRGAFILEGTSILEGTTGWVNPDRWQRSERDWLDLASP